MTTPDPAAIPMPDTPTPEQVNAFVTAAGNGDAAAVAAFAAKYPGFIDLRETANSWPALSAAAVHGHAAVITQLLAAGADIEKTDNFGWTPLHHAAWHNRKDIVAQLLAAGARVDARTGKGKTTLMQAAQQDQIEIATLLLEAGAKINDNDFNGNTVISSALQSRPEMKKLLEDWPQIMRRRAEEKAEAERRAREQAAEQKAEKSSSAVIDKLKSAPPRKNPFKRGGP